MGRKLRAHHPRRGARILELKMRHDAPTTAHRRDLRSPRRQPPPAHLDANKPGGSIKIRVRPTPILLCSTSAWRPGRKKRRGRDAIAIASSCAVKQHNWLRQEDDAALKKAIAETSERSWVRSAPPAEESCERPVRGPKTDDGSIVPSKAPSRSAHSDASPPPRKPLSPPAFPEDDEGRPAQRMGSEMWPREALSRGRLRWAHPYGETDRQSEAKRSAPRDRRRTRRHQARNFSVRNAHSATAQRASTD